MHAPGWKVAVLLLACAVTQPVQAMTTPEALQLFDLQSLSYTHFHRDKCGTSAIVQDPNGYSYPVRIGNILGRDFGFVVEISEERIRLKEVIKNANEEWFERESFLNRVDAPSSGMTALRDPLKQFDLQTLTYWHMGGDKCQKRASILHDGHVYSVTIGTRMGRNFGVVTRISKNRIVLRERYRKPDGTWLEKDVSIKVRDN